MQVLKNKVKNRILVAAEEVFYEKDFRSAKLIEIAEKADIPVGLIYTYFKNKNELFDKVVEDVYINFLMALKEEEKIQGHPFEKFKNVGEKYSLNLLDSHKKLVILMDKSTGTRHISAKQNLISRLQKHIEMGIKNYSKQKYDPVLTRILASNYTESLLEIARNYKDKEWAALMLELINQCYFKGTESL